MNINYVAWRSRKVTKQRAHDAINIHEQTTDESCIRESAVQQRHALINKLWSEVGV